MAATTTAALFAGTQALGGAAGFLGARSQARALRAQAKQEARVAEGVARLTELRAEDAVLRGEREARELGKFTRGLIGRQRASLAAQGIDLESGTALEVQEQTAAQGALDILTIRNNAWRQAFGFKAQAQAVRQQARFGRLGARQAARATILTGGLGFARDLAQGAFLMDRFRIPGNGNGNGTVTSGISSPLSSLPRPFSVPQRDNSQLG